jgi:glycosyltransferase involved in cell wall biosynthesis
VVTTHDTLHELLPGTFPWRTRYRPWLYRHCARRADAVLTDSEASRAQVVRLYGIPPAQVHAVPLAADAAFAFADPAAPPVRLRHRLGDGPLVLFVGGFARRRNLPALVRAFARCRGLLPPDSRLVLAGDNPLGVPIADIAQRAGAGGAVHVLGHVPDDELRALYQAASVFVYPSDHEGFGLPVLEAMAAGTPVITLDNSSLGEVVGGAGMLLPRADEELLADAMRRMLCDGRLRGACAEQGRRRAAMFSWVRTARQTMDVLAGVADSR